MSVYKQRGTKNSSYGFTFDKQRIQKSTRQSNLRVARQMEAAHRVALAKNLAGFDTTPQQEFDQRHRHHLSPDSHPPKSAHVYLLEGEHGYYKIGVARDVEQRAEQIQAGVPFKVKVLHSFHSRDAREAEFELHLQFHDKRVNGEWFKLAPEDVACICAKGGI
jgi:hypothetical protein